MRLLRSLIASEPVGVLAGSAVTLRPPLADDFPEWRDLRLASRAFLEPWEPSWDERDHTRLAFRERLQQYRTLSSSDVAYCYFIFVKSTGALCGAITLSNIRRGAAQMGTLGYWIGAPFARRGLMTDAVNTLVQSCRTDLALHRVEAACLPRNEASINLLKRCGFSEEGRAKAYLKIAGTWEDHVLFAKVLTGIS